MSHVWCPCSYIRIYVKRQPPTSSYPGELASSDHSSQTKRGLARATEPEASGFPAELVVTSAVWQPANWGLRLCKDRRRLTTAPSATIWWPWPGLPLSPLFRSGCTGRGLDTRLGLLLVALTEFIWGVGCRKIDRYPRPPAAKFSPRTKLPPR